MKVSRGDIVLVDFPYSDQTGSKVRPALVVQDDRWNATLQDTVLAVITSSSRRFVGAPTQFFVALVSDEGQSAGLRADSVVECNNLVTYDTSLILLHLGTFSNVAMADVDDCLRASLGL